MSELIQAVNNANGVVMVAVLFLLITILIVGTGLTKQLSRIAWALEERRFKTADDDKTESETPAGT